MSSLEPPTVPPARAGPKKMRRCLSFYEKLCLISDQILKEKSKNKKKVGALTVEVWGDGVPRQEAADCDLVDDVEQQEGHTGEAEGLQETPCVAWRSRRARVSPRWALCLDYWHWEGRMGAATAAAHMAVLQCT